MIHLSPKIEVQWLLYSSCRVGGEAGECRVPVPGPARLVVGLPFNAFMTKARHTVMASMEEKQAPLEKIVSRLEGQFGEKLPLPEMW